MDSAILFVGNTTFDTIGVLKQDIRSSSFNELAHLDYSFGGKAANTAIYCANLGIKVAYIGTVGSDFESIGYRKYLESRSVDVAGVFYVEEKTPRYFSLRWRDKEYSFVTSTEVLKNQQNQLQKHLSKIVSERPAKIVYCAINEDMVLSIFETAKMRGKQTAWNPLKTLLSKEQLEQILRRTDFLFTNESEAAALESNTSLSLTDFYRTYGIAIVCVTLGEQGCILIDKGIATSIPAVPVDVVDTTGAGDAFAGTFLAANQLFNSTKLCAELANIVGSLVVQNLGAQIEMPTLEQLDLLRGKFFAQKEARSSD